jgi:hypothetical protein
VRAFSTCHRKSIWHLGTGRRRPGVGLACVPAGGKGGKQREGLVRAQKEERGLKGKNKD